MSEIITDSGALAQSAAQIDIIKVDLASGTVHRSFLDHVICQSDNRANIFGARLYMNGEPVSILTSPTCAGYFILPNGNTVLIQGSVYTSESGETICSVTLPQECYAFPGQFTLAIKVHTNSSTATVRIVDGTIVKTMTGEPIDPGIPVPDIDELLSIIAAAQGHTYDASNGVTLSGATFKLTGDVRKHLNTIRHFNVDHGESIDLKTSQWNSGWLVIFWHCGTGSTYGIKFAHVNTESETNYTAVNMALNSTDNCQLAYDTDEANEYANPHWTITNGHESADMRALVIMSTAGENFC